MTMRMNPAWAAEQRAAMGEYLAHQVPYTITSHVPQVTKWLIAELVERNISYKLIKRGAGVTTITTDTNICPKCGGTGKC